jgi:hypothetical protein
MGNIEIRNSKALPYDYRLNRLQLWKFEVSAPLLRLERSGVWRRVPTFWREVSLYEDKGSRLFQKWPHLSNYVYTVSYPTGS